MKISAKTEYALRTIIHLALELNKETIRVADIAKEQCIPVQFLEQILLALKTGGLVKSRRGLNGGYRLAKEPSQIVIADIIRVIQPSLLDSPELEDGTTNHINIIANELWSSINDIVSSRLKEITILSLTEMVEKRRDSGALSYHI